MGSRLGLLTLGPVCSPVSTHPLLPVGLEVAIRQPPPTLVQLTAAWPTRAAEPLPQVGRLTSQNCGYKSIREACLNLRVSPLLQHYWMSGQLGDTLCHPAVPSGEVRRRVKYSLELYLNLYGGGGIRTLDHLLARQVLYQAELLPLYLDTLHPV